MDLTFDEIFEACREGVRQAVTEPARQCRDCGRPFRSEGSVVCDLDKVLCVPCIGAALSRVTD